MFNEKEIQEKIKNLKGQVFQQSDSQIIAQKEKITRGMQMSVIAEEDFEQTIKMKSNLNLNEEPEEGFNE